MTQSIPLNKLVISPRNVRKTNPDEDIAGLAESIASKGLLQNLVVSPSAKKGMFEVDAGGRRLLALQLLAERKTLPKNWPVPAIVIGQENATEASLAENLQKVAMNPADEVEAFAAIIQAYADNGMSSDAERVANCARRFGVAERHVKQRLALAALAPEILGALRDGGITLAAASAYASHPDHAEQLKVFKAHEKRAGSYGKHEAREIRDALKGRIYALDHPLVRYVGIEAYRAAGGEIATDLFFEEDERDILLNPALVERLASEKGEAAAQQLAQAEGWLDATLMPVTGHSWNLPKPPAGYISKWCQPAELPAEQRAEAIAIFELGDGEPKLHANYCFVAREADEPGGIRQRIETPEEREARNLAEEIRFRAARLAAPMAAGTAFEGRAFWPIDRRGWFHPFEVDDAGETVTLVLLVKVPVAEVDAQLEEAERRLKAEQQELLEEQEALAAQADDADSATDDYTAEELQEEELQVPAQ